MNLTLRNAINPSQRPLPRFAIVSAVLIVLIVITIAVMSFITVDAFINESHEVSSAQTHMTELVGLMASLEKAEDASRGFILTNQNDYLSECDKSLSNISVQYDRLTATSTQERRVSLIKLKSIIDERIERLKQGIALAVIDIDHQKARTFIESGKGKELMDRIAVEERTIEDSERSSIEFRERSFTFRAHLVKMVDFIAGALAMLIVLGSTVAIIRHWSRRIGAEHALEIANQRLESDVAQRTADLAEVNMHLQQQAHELSRSNQELESFSFSVSHDLRAPLRVIEGLSGILLRQTSGSLDERSRSSLDLIMGNARRMRDLIEDLLAFSKIGFQDIQPGRVDMDSVAAESWSDCKAPTIGHVVTFSVEPLPPCRGDKKLLLQVMINLLSNAVKYSRTKAESNIRVTGTVTDGLAEYIVTDNGVGFDMNGIGKLFGVFQRLHEETEFEGTGIGLAICRRIVERHGGTIRAESVPNLETRFIFTIPAWT